MFAGPSIADIVGGTLDDLRALRRAAPRDRCHHRTQRETVPHGSLTACPRTGTTAPGVFDEKTGRN